MARAHLALACAALLSLAAAACVSGPPPRPTSPSRPATGVEHTVQKGETLWKISRAYGVSIETIALANELGSSSRIDVGQKLFIPGATQALALSAATPTPPPPSTPSRSTPPRSAPASSAATTSTKPPSAMPALKSKADEAERHEELPTARSTSGDAPITSSQYVPPPKSPERPLAWPVRGVIYAQFGKRAESVHDGIDLAAPEGTPIRAAADGSVLFSAVQQGYGNLIIVEHEGGLLTLYAHNRKNLVREGERVRLGQVIAHMGTGTATSGPYLHFEVRIAGMPKNPLDYLPPPR